MTCTYDFKGPDGKPVRITGMEAFKEYLSNGGLEFLLPARAEDAGFKRTPVSQAAARNPEREAKQDDAAFAEAKGWSTINADTIETLPTLTDAQSKKDITLMEERLDGKRGLETLKDRPYRAVRLRDADILGAIGEAFGVRAVGFDLNPGAAQKYDFFSGVTFKASGSNAVYLGARSSRPHLALLGHETAHQLRTQRPDLYNKLVDAVSKYVDVAKYEGEFVNSPVAVNVKTVDGKQEEFMGEVLSDAFMDPIFWNTLAKEGKSVFKNVYNIVVKLLGKLVGTSYAKKAAPYLTDYDRVMQIAGEVLAELEGKPAPAKRSLFGFTFAEKDASFAEKDTAPEGLTPDEQGKFRKFQAEFQDNNNRIKQVQDRISEMAGTKVPEYADYYMAETNRPGRIAARLEDFREKMQAPLVERIAKSGNTIAQVEELAHAMHALERNRAIAKINPKHDPDSKEFIGVEGSGMNTDVAADIMDKYKYDKALQQHVKDLQGIARATLDIKLASGRLGRDQYDAYTNAYDFYVPLKGDGEYGPNVKRAMGHESRDEHVVENVMRDYEQAVVTAERNLSRQSLLQLVLGNPDSKLWTVGVTPKGRYVAGQVFTIVKGNEEIASFTSQSQVDAFMEAKGSEAFSFDVLDERGDRVKEFAKPLQANEVPVYIDGQRVRIQINDETLAGQLRPMDQKQMSWVRGKFNSVQRYLSRIYTAYSPTFIITNPLRDVQTGTINMLGNQGASVAAKAWTKYPGALKALAKFAATGQEPGGDTGRMLKEYRMNGGKTGASHMSDLEDQGKTLQRLYDDAYGASGYMADGKVGKAAVIAGRKMLMSLAHVIEVTNQATENALRLSLYMTLREGGATPGVAAQAAKNVTVNFDRKGNQTGVMGALYLFFNPAVQGTANAMRTLFHGEHKKQAWAALSTLAMLGMWAASQGIDDDEDRWLGEGWDVRSKKLVMNIGGKKIVVPLSLEFAPFFAAGVALEEARRGAVTKTEATGRLLSSFIDAYVPFKGLFSYDSDNKPLDAATALTPTLLRPFVEAATNRNAFGSKIVPESDFTKDRPDNLKMNRNTKGTMFDTAAHGIASAGEVAGAGRYENDITKVSPEMLKHWWRTYTGGLGTFIADMGGLAKLGAEDPTVIEMADVPVLKAFAKGQDVAPIRGRFYDLSKDARAASTEFKQAKKAGDDEAIDAILNNPSKAELLGMERLVSKTTKAAAALRDEMVDINADKAMALSEKRAALKALEKDEEELYRSAIGAFK